MKAIAYVIAVLAAVGIVVAISSTDDSASSDQAASSVEATAVSVAATAGEVTLEVPGMHCQHACYPRVKKTLERQPNVTEVALVDQPDPEALTVKQVVVKYDAGFEANAAVETLHGAGFADAVILQ
ncbi:MAG: heavy metal-associated domain-containing protein [Planctomycetota bacterium]